MQEPLRVGYILKMFPRLSETFILNELLELERQGAQLSVFSLLHPNDGRFHGRVADLSLTAEYFPRDRPDKLWNRIWELPAGQAAPIERWAEGVEFLRRYEIPGDLDLLLRAVLIGARARSQGIQHLHAHFATVATRVAALVNLLTGIPYSFTAHAKDIFRETVNRELFAELANRSAFCVTVSDFNREYILEQTPGIDASKVLRLYNGIDLSFFQPSPQSSVPEVPHIVSVGRLVPKKGFDHLLRSLDLCKRDGLRFRATIVGDGEQRAELLALRDRLGLESEVAFVGAQPQEEVQRLCADATLIALACVPDRDGNMDALPTVLLESLALDRPIVSTRLTGVPEIVGDEGGLLVEPGDDAAFANAIAGLWETLRSGAFASGTARARAERLFDLRRNAGRLREMFEQSAVGHPTREAL